MHENSRRTPLPRWSRRSGGHLGAAERVDQTFLTSNEVGDAPMLPELLNQIPPEHEIASVTADGACDTRKCHDAIAERGAAAVIPPRKNAKPWKADSGPGQLAATKPYGRRNTSGRVLWR